MNAVLGRLVAHGYNRNDVLQAMVEVRLTPSAASTLHAPRQRHLIRHHPPPPPTGQCKADEAQTLAYLQRNYGGGAGGMSSEGLSAGAHITLNNVGEGRRFVQPDSAGSRHDINPTPLARATT